MVATMMTLARDLHAARLPPHLLDPLALRTARRHHFDRRARDDGGRGRGRGGGGRSWSRWRFAADQASVYTRHRPSRGDRDRIRLGEGGLVVVILLDVIVFFFPFRHIRG